MLSQEDFAIMRAYDAVKSKKWSESDFEILWWYAHRHAWKQALRKGCSEDDAQDIAGDAAYKFFIGIRNCSLTVQV